MKAKSFKRVLALALTTAMILTACGQKASTNASESKKTSESAVASDSGTVSESKETEVKREDMPTISLFPRDERLFSGLRTGYQGDYLAEEIGIQLEVWAYSKEKETAMLTSGDLPDIFYAGDGGVETLEMLIETDKIINYEDYKDQLPNFFGENLKLADTAEENIALIRENYSAGTGGLYVLPVGVAKSYNYYNSLGNYDRNVVKLKWDVYEAIGAPEITDMWQLLDVVEDMLEYQPTHPDGTKMYGTFLDNGQDNTRWGCMWLWYLWHGYDQTGADKFVEIDLVNGTVESIFEDDSLYKEGVKWYNEIYRRGLMDPDSISTTRADQAPKLDAGYAMMPAGTLPGWETKYYEVFVPGNTVYVNYGTGLMGGVGSCMVINKNTEHLEECLAFVNLMADPFSVMVMTYGPEGDVWEIDGNTLKITDRFAEWLEETGNVNFFPLSDGTEWSLTWNTAQSSLMDTIQNYVGVDGSDLYYIPTSWPDALAITTQSENFSAWKETMNAEGLNDYCEKNNITVHTESAFRGVILPTMDDSMLLTISTIKDVVVPATWQCVYAESEEEFEEIWDQMVEDAMALGAQDIIDWMKENYKPNN